jgi:hypothetical protein
LIGGPRVRSYPMNASTNVRAALAKVRLTRRSWRGLCCPKGNGKKLAHKADRRLGKALAREEG